MFTQKDKFDWIVSNNNALIKVLETDFSLIADKSDRTKDMKDELMRIRSIILNLETYNKLIEDGTTGEDVEDEFIHKLINKYRGESYE